ncbi:signal peptidase II [Anaerotignum propionicum]|uniref:Lipoprotein signal peptidase n=1 Tax=Anaerotignum propionicum DSM 1682 TaxID=991789 RepID=A0A0X8VD24_ANAPI|nr:signal peptidase II [Anaerotignum propionicum]AMJ41784.1 lipoprotein signal peptidase [Anaerotignum propionicum DSM 1682]MEA5057431.1 signal peptidase II [Anaerotignum propionicum]SHE84516.1 signal peptidase II [[Clostridium] propionicum DSM 1682] [Anaerotignum propionicum DSM 1682]
MWLIPAFAAIILIGLDQATKYLALTNLKPIGSMVFMKGFLDFTFVENRGVAFGMFSGQRWFILLLTAVITVALLYYYNKLPRTKEYQLVRMVMILIFSGAIGNMIDRVFRGYVVDFFEFSFFKFPVFNVADIYVVVGVCILAFLILFVIKEPEEKKKDE